MNLPGKILSLALTLLCLNSFAQSSYDFKKAEADCRKLIYTNPEAALGIIKKTLSQEMSMHDTIYGNTYHLYGLYHSMKGNQDSTIYYIKKSLTFLDDYPRNRARSLFSISMAYRKKANYKASLKCLNEIAEINKKEKNVIGQAMLYGEMASNYSLMLDYDKSIELLVKAVALMKGENNKKQIIPIKQKLANTYLAKENYKFAIDLYKECITGFKEIGSMKNYYLTNINLGEAYLHVKNYTEAKRVLNIAAEGLYEFGDKELIGLAYSKIGNIESLNGSYYQAIALYKKAFDDLLLVKSPNIIRISGEYISVLNKINKYDDALEVIRLVEPLKLYESANLKDQMVYKNAVGDTYHATRKNQEAIDAYQETIAIKDSLASNEKKSAVQEIQAKYQTEIQRERNLVLEANNKALEAAAKTERWIALLYIIVSIAIIILTLSLLRSYKLQNKLQKEELNTIAAKREIALQQRQHADELIYQQKNIISEKERELISTALRMANYQDNINLIISKCESNELTKVADVKRELEYLIKQKDYWKQFEKRFNTLHPEFNNSLTSKFSKLTKNDLEFCSLLKLNLSNKEIASLLQISHESVITKKYRIKKKMAVTDDFEFEKMLSEI